jgi:hypothetical protein
LLVPNAKKAVLLHSSEWRRTSALRGLRAHYSAKPYGKIKSKSAVVKGKMKARVPEDYVAFAAQRASDFVG